MLDDAVRSGDWPGWDEAWVPIVFPLEIPLAVTAALTLGGAGMQATSARLVTLVTGAVWLWGAAIFVVWFILGDRVPNYARRAGVGTEVAELGRIA
jgi:hypothetical protein